MIAVNCFDGAPGSSLKTSGVVATGAGSEIRLRLVICARCHRSFRMMAASSRGVMAGDVQARESGPVRRGNGNADAALERRLTSAD
jgi:hypothetical protein